jgi:tRNA dimethylallyltransferase
MEKIVVIVGPTSSGKTNLSLKLAKVFKGEVVSADSRQIYQGFDLCSGKITPIETKGIPHHLLSIASPQKTYTVTRFLKDAAKAIKAISAKGHLPIIVGGTNFYINALVSGINLPKIPPNPALRKKLEQKSVPELFYLLKTKDPERAKTIDPHNPRRLIRSLEIIDALGKVPKLRHQSQYQVLFLGLNPKLSVLRKRIAKRLKQRLSLGLVKEIKQLHDQQKLSWPRLESFGLELKYVSLYLQAKLSYEQMAAKLNIEIYRYAKRQLTWLKKYPKNTKTFWISNFTQAKKLVKDFLD